MFSRKMFKIKGPRFQRGKLDKNESARSLALKFGRLKNFCWLWGGGGGGGAIALLGPR